jgi:hypothetical protein
MHTPRRFVSGPLITRLRCVHRTTVNEAMRSGRYGQTFRIGRIVYADLAEVSRAEGRSFSEEQLDLASAGLTDRIITVRTKEAADGTAQA